MVRSAGSAASGDVAVDEAATGITGALALFAEVYGRASYDGAGAPVSLTVHYGQDYDNAFWDGTQLVFGDGDGQVFGRFTQPVDVLGHELTHAVTEHTAGLVYSDQPGALNESVSDVFAACLKQRLLGQTPADADWLIGAGIFVPGIQARALRDMAAPGTAYDDPALGRDPQVGHLDDYVSTSDDNGGVHLNSGIPNRAFQLAAVADRRLDVGGRRTDLVRRAHRRRGRSRVGLRGLRRRHRGRGRCARRRRRHGVGDGRRDAGVVRRGTVRPPARSAQRAGWPYVVPAASPACAPTASSTSTATTRGPPRSPSLVDRVDLRAVPSSVAAPGPVRLRLRPLRRLARPSPSSTSPPTSAASPTCCSSRVATDPRGATWR